MTPFLRPAAEGVFLEIHVQPRASRTAITGIQGNALKVRLTSPPVDGAANRLCIEFFAKLLGLPKRDVILAAGDKSRHKRLLLLGVDEDRVRKVLIAALAEHS